LVLCYFFLCLSGFVPRSPWRVVPHMYLVQLPTSPPALSQRAPSALQAGDLLKIESTSTAFLLNRSNSRLLALSLSTIFSLSACSLTAASIRARYSSSLRVRLSARRHISSRRR